MVSGTNEYQKRDFRTEIMQNDTVEIDFRCTATHLHFFSAKFSIPLEPHKQVLPIPPKSQPPSD